ncbi:N-acetylneuraminate 9-O-acetyltransferase-like [Daphnia pulex]|uniref:N-acetylneuraminate 9-O-acetyltransferase-like n=1 Tax=Daphnia pulex TaxID=6669 RepID=UPI001EDEBFD5|nr:N-acetylneuraminate 9-O-acetyltransferase-like [Daphnia pulex]
MFPNDLQLCIRLAIYTGKHGFIIMVYVFVIIFCCFHLMTNGEVRSFVGMSMAGINLTLSKKELSICKNNLLDLKAYHYENWVSRSYNSQLSEKRTYQKSCRLLKYTTGRAVKCIDALNEERINQENLVMENNSKIFQKLHFVFVGDSRMRQQFYNFLKLIPDYDRKTQPIKTENNSMLFHHHDIDVESKILRLLVSFKWRPIINETVMETIHEWEISEKTEKPHMIILSIEVYHMLEENGGDFKMFEEKAKQLFGMLHKLSTNSQVIWLNQYPTIDFGLMPHIYKFAINSEKIHQYNKAVRYIIKNPSNIRIWDSSNTLAEEYVRGCVIFPERESEFFFSKTKFVPFEPINTKPYINCQDFIHIGYAALSQATQIFYNDLCNGKVYSLAP